ncbi:MAG TPA: hypothetical protein VFA16_02760 [Mycobacterium sp.]|uniref:hypothetical protein n=1 Tax=Mycobacterium sp. TaxID=1785 RepID=UPI002D451E20|nr:hypothetical protein [Mycobacterium sp.]HZU46171.1 hypothetical protein [Mycobacterium sp.]
MTVFLKNCVEFPLSVADTAAFDFDEFAYQRVQRLLLGSVELLVAQEAANFEADIAGALVGHCGVLDWRSVTPRERFSICRGIDG